MIKLVVFDLDGVLVDARDLHYDAMNLALADIAPECVISREEHLSTYDGLPTKKKLGLLTEHKGLSHRTCITTSGKRSKLKQCSLSTA